MKKLIYTIILLAGLAILQACTKNYLELPSFEVSTSKSSFTAGEAIEFKFSGNPNMITFYSGVQGNKFENRNRVTAQGIPTLQFTSLAANGTQTNSLHLMVSSDFEGKGIGGDSAALSNIAKATWTDITSRAILSSGTSTASGTIDLSDFASMGKPIYIAFKYTAETGSIQRKWTISGLTVINTLPDLTVYTLANHTSTAISNYGNSNLFSPGWVAYKVSNSFNWVVSTTSLVITGATTAAAATAPAEAWGFSGPINLEKVTPDLGIIVKDITTKAILYSTKYTLPGTYTATFVGSNTSVYSEVEKVSKKNVTITP